MSEAIITRRSGAGSKMKTVLNTLTFTNSNNWKVPSTLANNTVSVRIFGAGGSGYIRYQSTGGGGGWMNNGDVTVTPGQTIPITIGVGQASGAGGSSSFGTYLSANGGYIGYGGSGGGSNDSTDDISSIDGYQFGGGGGSSRDGGNGGMWGGGGGGGGGYFHIFNGGHGGTYGGGGGYTVDIENLNLPYQNHFGYSGNGGVYGCLLYTSDAADD